MKLSKVEKLQIQSSPTIGYWSALGGVEVIRFEHLDEDYIVCKMNAWSGHPTYHRVKVNYPLTKFKESRPYIVLHWQRLYLDECLRA